MSTDLSLLCAPRVIALVGASDDPGSIGGRTLANLAEHSLLEGELLLVNPKREQIGGRRCWPDVASLPTTPDLVVVAVPAVHVNTVLRQSAARGVPFAIVFSSGFAEVGPEGQALEDEMRAIVAGSKLRVYGPNCPGLCNINKRLGITFSPSFRFDLRRGPVGLATQGGGLGRNVVQAMDRGLGIGLWCSSGNEVDLQVSDFISHMADADDIEVIVTLLEGIKDGAKFIRAVQRATANGKPVVALKVGRSVYGQRAALSHTGSLTGSAEVNSTLFRQLGVIEVDDIDELADMAALLSRARPPKRGHDVAIYCSSGGASALTADMVGQAGIQLATFEAKTTAALAACLPSYAAIGNPVDTTTAVISNPSVIDSTLLAVCEDPNVALVLMPITLDYGDTTLQVAQSTVRVQAKSPVPILPVWMSSRFGAGHSAYADAGMVATASVGKAVKVVRRWLDYGRWLAAQETAAPFEPLVLRAGAGVQVAGETVTLTEFDAKAMLRQAGFSTLASGLADSREGSSALAGRIGYPVVAKVASAQVLHKSDVGGVLVNLITARRVEQAWDAIHANVGAARPDATIDGLLIEAMAPEGGIETLVGVTRDPVFGYVLTFGIGGIHVELLNDVVRRVLPLTQTEAEAMVRELRAFPLLDGSRGQPKADVAALVALLVKVSDFVAANADRLEEFDLNPVWVGRAGVGDGPGAIPLDAVIIGRFGAKV